MQDVLHELIRPQAINEIRVQAVIVGLNTDSLKDQIR